jgi:hypothetical protein
MEWIKPLKPHLREAYRCHADRADLFVYFYELAVNLLRSGGQSAYIASSNWNKTAAGQTLRQFLRLETTLLRFLDVSDARVFEDASTYPCILVFRKGSPNPDHLLLSAAATDVRSIQRRTGRDPLEFEVPQASLTDSVWRFERPAISLLREKLTSSGTRIVDLCGSPLYGIKSGLNEAFVIERHIRDEILSGNPECTRILKPFLEGKDVKPWRVESRDLWLIYLEKGVDVTPFPAVLEHLAPFRERLEKRATRQAWYELQQPQSRYAARFAKPKIIYPRFVDRPMFALDTTGHYVNNALSVLPVDDPVLLFCLMSPVTWFFLLTAGAPMANGYRQIHGHVLEDVPIPVLSKQARQRIHGWITDALDNRRFEDPPWELLYDAFELSRDETQLLAEETAPWK